MKPTGTAIIARMLNPEDHHDLAERCVRLAKASSEPNVAQYLMALAANYLELAEFAGAQRRQPATIVQLDGRRKASPVGAGGAADDRAGRAREAPSEITVSLEHL